MVGARSRCLLLLSDDRDTVNERFWLGINDESLAQSRSLMDRVNAAELEAKAEAIVSQKGIERPRSGYKG